jgi:predicted enzyme related to lactoylglutathione lyase
VEALGRLGTVVLDCHDPERLAAFWGAVLGVGVSTHEPDWVALEAVHPDGPQLAFQVVPEAKRVKNRVHVDVDVPDLEAATLRVEALGGQRLGGVVEEDGDEYQVLADPEGNEFCLVVWSSQ